MSDSRRHHDAVWEALPAPLVPEQAELRERFLLDWIERERERLGRAPRVLDVGCGEGWFAAALTATGAEVVAIDVAAEAVRRARAAHGDLDVRLIEPEAELPLADAEFNAVWAGETIEHVTDVAGLMSELRRVLCSSGLLLLSTPDHGPLRRLWLGLWRPAFEASFDPRSEHVRFFTRRALYELLDDFGFEDVEVRGAGGVPGARSTLLCVGRRSRF